MWVVFEKNLSNKLKQLSIELETEEQAKAFMAVLVEGWYYKTNHPEYELVYSQINLEHGEKK